MFWYALVKEKKKSLSSRLSGLSTIPYFLVGQCGEKTHHPSCFVNNCLLLSKAKKKSLSGAPKSEPETNQRQVQL